MVPELGESLVSPPFCTLVMSTVSCSEVSSFREILVALSVSCECGSLRNVIVHHIATCVVLSPDWVLSLNQHHGVIGGLTSQSSGSTRVVAHSYLAGLPVDVEELVVRTGRGISAEAMSACHRLRRKQPLDRRQDHQRPNSHQFRGQ